MKVYVEAPKDSYNTPSNVDSVLVDLDIETIEWHKTFLEDGKWKVTGYTITKKEIYNG